MHLMNKTSNINYPRLILLLALSFSSMAYAEIYKWVDDQGRIHYSDKPVKNSTQINVNTQKQSTGEHRQSREEKRRKLLNVFNEDRARKNKEKEKKRAQKKKQQRNCVLARDRLRRYERASYIYDLDKDGKRIVMSSEERERETRKLRKRIEKYCR